MTTQYERHLRACSDPQTLVDYAVLRDEMNKLHQLRALPDGQLLPAAQQIQTEQHLQQLFVSYALQKCEKHHKTI
ncbi:hypothetical protein IM311_19290 [Enterobacter cloacae complex sp. P40RS]|uniref:Uncharacterized protein n=1 Tax=Enterobacter pasteurii TaxID=3029761 RepID=A0ABR9QBQ9_9ENTR|nr:MULTISPECIES: hypothetical protein [Enterobacter cloacae complex]MBE4856211.1 hypothetical protein [Enterobacter pasteurii]MBE4863865.1 hypothetical protein [Enterobacter cloacae complex sp. P40C2]MBE4875978.1 hypothetical protein [Enterobacter cloacae complex sp. P40C]